MAQSKRDTLPIYRIKTIMKSSPGVENVSVGSVHLVAKATELFLKQLARESLRAGGGGVLEYKNVAKIVGADRRYEFLRDMVPRKITVREYKQRMNGRHMELETSDESDSSESESSEADSVIELSD